MDPSSASPALAATFFSAVLFVIFFVVSVESSLQSCS